MALEDRQSGFHTRLLILIELKLKLPLFNKGVVKPSIKLLYNYYISSLMLLDTYL